ncbi:hypothetical protein ONZ51_g6872 [Trametes cubensis]|uniref:galacturonan 1,4-alpha-galacturonidase n=1 Tax=Trametes cubensis TaxID=1111947 RepID=A0AAD7TRF9_9APHY|nr:hypothetical protein ONZ51_g6872 [Trametes cubensis]
MLAKFLALASLAAVSLAHNTHNTRKTCEVPAKGAGQDDGPTINSVFKKCSHNSKIVLDKYYVVDTLLLTQNLDNVEIELSGTGDTTFWFLSGNNIHMYGGGTIDGNGQVWWDTLNNTHNSGTAGGSSTTFARPIPLTVGNATNVVIENIHEIGSPFWNNFVYQSNNVTYKNINIRAVSYSSSPTANSDGWDIYRSSHVTVRDSVVNNDDDCVSFKPNSTNIVVANMWCNGSHGISVGSLGQYAGETDIVANVSVTNITMLNAQNGARIKVFGGNPSPNSTVGGGTGYVKNITFKDFHGKHFLFENVENPILINQSAAVAASDSATRRPRTYARNIRATSTSPTSTVRLSSPSPLRLSPVFRRTLIPSTFRAPCTDINVHGTSAGTNGNVVVDMECSDTCEDITATGTHLSSPNGTAVYICKNIASTAQVRYGVITRGLLLLLFSAPKGTVWDLGDPGTCSSALRWEMADD